MRITVIASLGGKIVSKYCNISKSLGGSIYPPCTTVGVWICMYVRGLITRTVLSENNLKNFASNKKSGQLCFALYRALWPLLFLDISLTYTLFIRKNVNLGKRVALFAEYFLSLFFFFFFLSKEKADTFTQANIARLCCDETNSWASQTVYMRKDWPG